jgi:hypothetical protein
LDGMGELMALGYVVEPFGPPISELKSSDLCDLSLGFAGLRVAVHLGEDEDANDRFVEIVFTAPRGFRYLDEGDLLPYWGSGAFDTSRHLVFEIKRGGWAEQEEQSGMFNVTAAVGTFREWFIASSSACLNVISTAEPLIRIL